MDILYRTCISCGDTIYISMGEHPTNLVCQKCGSAVFKINSSVTGECGCCHKMVRFGSGTACNGLHICDARRSCTIFYFKPETSDREVVEIKIQEPRSYEEATVKIAIPYYNGGQRIERAVKTWIFPETVFVLNDEFIIPPGSGTCSQLYTPNSSQKFGIGKRNLPLVMDIFKRMYNAFPECKFIGYCNSDIILPPGKSIYSLLPANGKSIAIHHRLDVGFHSEGLKTWEAVSKGQIVLGKDCFIIERNIVQRMIAEFPEMILGMPFWDTALACWLFNKIGPEHIDFCYGELWHEAHKTPAEEVQAYEYPEGQYNRKQMGTVGGLHAWGAILDHNHARKVKKKTIGIVQPGRLGDIFIVLPIAKWYFDRGYHVVWPVIKNFTDVFERATYVDVIPIEERNCYSNSHEALRQRGIDNIIDLGIGFGRDVSGWHNSGMKFDEWKYHEAQVPFEEKYNLRVARDPARERELAETLRLGKIKNGYVVTHSTSSFAKYNFNVPSIELGPMDGFNPVDWCGVIENAYRVFCVDSSMCNLINQLGLAQNRRYIKTWHDIRSFAEANRLTPELASDWKPWNPIKYKQFCYPDYINDNNASSHIIEYAKKFCVGHGIDFGGGAHPFPGVASIDIKSGLDATEFLESCPSDNYDFIFSSHFLEHTDNPQEIISQFYRVLKTGGNLFLYLPHASMAYWSIQNPEMRGPYGHKVDLIPSMVSGWMKDSGFKIKECFGDDFIDHYWSFWVIGSKVKLKKRRLKNAT